MKMFFDIYVGKASADDPAITPMNGDLTAMQPAWVCAAECDVRPRIDPTPRTAGAVTQGTDGWSTSFPGMFRSLRQPHWARHGFRNRP